MRYTNTLEFYPIYKEFAHLSNLKRSSIRSNKVALGAGYIGEFQPELKF